MALGLLLAAAPAFAASDTPGDDLIRAFVRDPAAAKGVLAHLDTVLQDHAGSDPRLRAALMREVTANLGKKRALGPAFTLSPGELERTVIDYEAFKLRTFAASGVFPKRYFGYFDERWDTAAREAQLRHAVCAAVDELNAAEAAQSSPLRFTDAEVAVTFISEGGALLLGERQAEADRVHPVQGVGLDDIAIGVSRRPDLVKRLDKRLGTRLEGIVAFVGEGSSKAPVLSRFMTFPEAIAGTALMYQYEKQLAAAKLAAAGRGALEARSLDEQFIIASLVYNSGILFSAERIEAIRTFSSGAYLEELSRNSSSKRWPLPVFTPAGALERLRAGAGYPVQPTSWSAVYHVLQRYGGFAGLRRFTPVFDERGAFQDREGC
ncbi:MAG: hypothetical protein ACYC8T_28700 [Myxococcaceae bacterium]